MSEAKKEGHTLRVFKFGGASVKDAAGLLNVARIIKTESLLPGRIVLVVSAMGKTTNALEALLDVASRGQEYRPALDVLIHKHLSESSLALASAAPLLHRLNHLRHVAEANLQNSESLPFDETYDQFVSLGEILSSEILAAVLHEHVPSVALLDARKLICTDSTFRAPQVDVELTFSHIQEAVRNENAQVLVVQGFIGSDMQSRTTTLGREGSDYTAALFGAALHADSVTVWKDVPGVLNADPRRLPTAHLLPRMTYADAAEMTFYGATVLHPKTLKPLAESDIPLYVRSFVDPNEPGTYIGPESSPSEAHNVWLQLDNVAFIRCHTPNLSFVTELHLSHALQMAHDVGLRILMLQASALELHLAVPQDFLRAQRLAKLLEKEFHVFAEYDLSVSTFIRADAGFIEANLQGKQVHMRQQTATTLWALTSA